LYGQSAREVEKQMTTMTTILDFIMAAPLIIQIVADVLLFLTVFFSSPASCSRQSGPGSGCVGWSAACGFETAGHVLDDVALLVDGLVVTVLN
jgi:hypothetical protein